MVFLHLVDLLLMVVLPFFVLLEPAAQSALPLLAPWLLPSLAFVLVQQLLVF